MAGSAEIGVNNSRGYQGNAALGGGSFGSFQLDTKPVEDLARYTMLYNKSEYDQRQKDAEAAALEIADYTSYDLTTGIPKDAKALQDKYDKVTAYARENPGATDYRNKEQWAKFKVMRNDLENDLKGAKVRNTMWALRQKEIQDQPNQELKDIMQKELNAEIEATDIRTPIKHSQQFEPKPFEIPAAKDISFDVTKVGPNAVVERSYNVFNVPAADSQAAMFAIGLKPDSDPSTPQGKRDIIANKNNPLLQGAEVINSVINAKDAEGNFIYKTKVTDGAGNVTFVLDESKLSTIPKNVLGLIKGYNKYVTELKDEIKSGTLRDKFEKPITFGEGALNEDSYAEINFQDGITPEELGKAAIFAKWKGDSYKTDVKQTDNAIQIRAQDITKRGQDMENARFWAGFNKGTKEDILSADAVIREVSDAVNSGTPTRVIESKGNKRIVRDNVVTIADPSLLKEFGSIDKEGNVTNVPSVVHYNEKTNKLALVYYKSDGSGYEKNDRGEPIVEREVEMQPTQWLGQVTKRKNPNKDIGSVNTLIDQVYNKYNRNLKSLADGYKGGATITVNKETTESGKSGASGSKRTYKGLDKNGNPIFE